MLDSRDIYAQIVRKNISDRQHCEHQRKVYVIYAEHVALDYGHVLMGITIIYVLKFETGSFDISDFHCITNSKCINCVTCITVICNTGQNYYFQYR